MSSYETVENPNMAASVYCSRCGRRLNLLKMCDNCGVGDDPRPTAPVERKNRGVLSTFNRWLAADGVVLDGQKLLVSARRILVVSGLMLALWNPQELGELKVEVGLILTLALPAAQP